MSMLSIFNCVVIEQHSYSCPAGSHSEDLGIHKATGLSSPLQLILLRPRLEDIVGRKDKDQCLHDFSSISTIASTGSAAFLNWTEN